MILEREAEVETLQSDTAKAALEEPAKKQLLTDTLKNELISLLNDYDFSQKNPDIHPQINLPENLLNISRKYAQVVNMSEFNQLLNQARAELKKQQMGLDTE